MSTPRLIGPQPASSTPAVGAPRRPRPIPEDLLLDASRRLGVLALLGASLWITATELYHRVRSADDPAWLMWQSTDLISVGSALVSLGLYRYTRGDDRDPAFILNLGLAYLIFTGLALGLVWHWSPATAELTVHPEVSWISVVILMFAALLPTPPIRMLAAALIAVSMVPLSMQVSHWLGHRPMASALDPLVMHYQDYLIVGVAVVIARVVVGLGQEVAKAREMGSYQLGELIGRGGMGEVYQATHRMLARPAAIKLIRPETIGANQAAVVQSALTRFRREAMSAASLRSPHTVSLYDFGVTGDGTFYFAMELLEGMDLQALVRTHGPQPPSRVVHILVQVCESLEEAHAAGLVHRDIKPANIHLGRLGVRTDFVKVLDFGLVKRAAVDDGTHTQATLAGSAMGTPAYMSPEAALGGTIDGRADLYALGCVAYFLLTGTLAFDQPGGLQTLLQRLQEDPPAPSTRTSQPIPPALDALVLACLARDPDDRPASARELRRRLQALGLSPWTEADSQAAAKPSVLPAADPLSRRP